MHQAYAEKDCSIEYTGDIADRAREGRITEGAPFFENESKEAVENMAKSWLLDNSRETVYLATDGKIDKWLRNDAVDQWMEKYYHSSAVYVSHLVFLITYIIALQLHDYGWLALVLAICIAGLYQLLWRIKIQNEIESAVVCEIMNILGLILIPVID